MAGGVVMDKRYRKRLLLIGSPNVGKSVLFNALTGAYAAVSNYPGTTVDISTGPCQIQGIDYEVIDTPGLYSLLPVTEEERVTRRLLFEKSADVVLQVIDAKNIRRMLPLTFELIDGALPVIVVLNMMDEACRQGLKFDLEKLSTAIKLPVIGLSALENRGIDQLRRCIGRYKYQGSSRRLFAAEVETALASIMACLPEHPTMSRCLSAYLLLQNDQEIADFYPSAKQIQVAEQVAVEQRTALEKAACQPISLKLASERQNQVNQLLPDILSCSLTSQSGGAARWLGRITRRPLTGLPILALVFYLGFYQIVGHFGAGFLVDYLDQVLFNHYLIPWIQHLLIQAQVSPLLQSLIVGEYGLFTLGVRYAVVIVLPIVSMFFLVFALLEDCGYLPRLALLTDQIFSRIGLNGRAAIPMMLGLGCGTMAVIATRTLETKRERLLATLLLALTVPCSTQLGVVLAMLSHNSVMLLVWLVYIVGVFIVIGYVSAKLLPGRRSPFFMELPPFRWPRLSNVLMKAYRRMVWYFAELMPVFLLTSFLLWLSELFALLPRLITMIVPVMNLLGLPPQAAKAFLMGFIRRDYGAAGMYDLFLAGQLSDSELLVACVTFTLFMPCLAQFMVMLKERGAVTSFIIVTVVFAVSLGSGAFIHFLVR
jgi:ferrous iron transport protein B